MWNENKAKNILEKNSHSQIKSQIMPEPKASATNVERGGRSPTSASPRVRSGSGTVKQRKTTSGASRTVTTRAGDTSSGAKIVFKYSDVRKN